jgi:hypothetical protein
MILIRLQLLGNSVALLHRQPCVQGLRAAAVADSFTATSLNWANIRTVIISKHMYIHIWLLLFDSMCIYMYGCHYLKACVHAYMAVII